MNNKREREEVLETLWHMKERGQASVEVLQQIQGQDFTPAILAGLVTDGLADHDRNAGTVGLTSEGETYARKLVRAHRLAERLTHDVLGRDSESGACEFEHIVNMDLVDSICTLLGHPRECPHGMPIPEGECCRLSMTSAETTVVPLTQLQVGQDARVAYVQCADDRRMHKLEDLLIRPGAVIRLHQVYPSFVVECEGASIALGQDVASSIRVWRPSAGPHAGEGRSPHAGRRGKFRFGRRWGRHGV
ncbi:MAG: hypothetical protein GF418_01350 [Chitinivibrionales bacterium]|nr:hypothetical protein [Chitinivibrionales bacterium]MBD3394248.1 hypothetical protein [Chitinivibrionales bacterium]